jgi:phosphoglycerol transferase MdoB-like AlkP superfamily enzyme
LAYNLRGIVAPDAVRREFLAHIDQAVASRPKAMNLSRLGGRNVLLVFVESYGSINFKNPGFAAVQLGTVAAFEKRVRDAGYQVYSDTLTSPITGGGSWMAHATMTTGIKIDNQDLYEVLLTGNIQAMGGVFRADGYRTIAAMPRMQQPWPEGAFFGFDKVYQDAAFDYRGRRFSWESMPDQLVLEKIHRFEIADAKQPLFIQYVLASSHAPFDLIPTLVPDPAQLTDGANYLEQPAQPFPVKDGRVFDNVAGYQASIRYSLDSISHYLAERLKDNSLIIVLGDHQPPLTVAAATRDKTVPIHVLSRDPAMLAPFAEAGWAAGMTPAFRASALSMEDFLAMFVSGFSVADAGVPAGPTRQ